MIFVLNCEHLLMLLKLINLVNLPDFQVESGQKFLGVGHLEKPFSGIT